MANRTKSLMKPLRREPLQDLPMITAANSDEDTTSTITLAALAKRRVSFSGRNSVKEYVPCAEPICVMSTPAYEETYAHLSSDSSGLCNNSGQNDENNMSQTLVNKMTLNRPHLVAPSARNQNNRIVPQPLRNSLPHQQVATLAATHDDSLNTSDMCMTEPISSKLYTTDIDMSHTTGDMLLTPVAGDTSSGDISFTLCEPGRPVNNVSTSMNFTSAANEAVSQNTSTCMSFTKAIVANFPADNSIIQNNSMSFTKAIVATDEKFSSQNNSTCMSFTKALVVHDENAHVLSQSSSSHMSFTKAMVANDDVLSQNNSTHMSLTEAIVVNDGHLQTDNVSSQNSSTHMSFTRAFAVNDVNATMTLDDSVTNNCKNATNFTMDAGTDEEMRRLMQEVEMEETLDSEKLKSYRLSDVSFLVRENLVSGKSKRANKRRSSIATASSNSPIDLSVTSNRFGQKNIDEEEEGEEEEEEMEVEEEGRGEKRNEKGSGEEARRLKEKEDRRLEEEEDRRRREESDGLGKEEECERERRSDLKEDIERKGLEEGGEELEEERPEDRREREDERLEEESARQRKESNEDEGRGREEEDVEEKEDVDRMETDAEIQGGKVNDLDMSIVEDNEEVTNGVKNKDKSGREEETLHLNLREETLCSREETLSKKTEETFCLNLNSVSEMVECSVARDDEREEKECDEGGVKEDGTGSGKEQSADNQSTPSNVVLSTGREEQLLQENTRNKRKSDSLDLSREELDVVESPSKLARMEAVTSPAITSDAPTVTSEDQPPNSTPEINANSATSRISRSSIGKRSSSSHSLDETCMSFSEMRESLEWNSSLNNSTRLSGALSASTSAPTPLFYVQEEVAPLETRYSFYEGAMVVRAERKSGATEELKAAEISVDADAKQPCLIFANKIKTLFAERVVACQSMSEVKDVISEINDFAFSHETNYKSLLRLWYNGRFEKIVNGRLKYVAICSGTMTWFTVFIDPDIIFEGLSDDAITVKQWVGEVQESYIKHLYRCCIRSPDRLKDFTDAIENYVNTLKT